MKLFRASTAIFVVAIQLFATAPAQDVAGAESTRKNELRLVLSRTDGTLGKQQYLRIQFINASETNIVLPTPTVTCADSMIGFVLIYKKALTRSKYPETGFGCAADRMAGRDILVEAKTWKKLAPNEEYSVTVPLSQLRLNSDARYKLRAKYYPAHFTPEELRLLAAENIAVVQQGALSDVVIIEPEE